jgi:hypothetical protein
VTRQPAISGSDGAAHGPDCECTRCAGFQEGNELGVRHGAHATLHLRPRANELAATIREALDDLYDRRYELAIASAAMFGARFEAANVALDDCADPERVPSLDARAARWGKLFVGTLAQLGLTPAAAKQLGFAGDPAGADRRRAALEQHVRDVYGDAGAGS